MINNTKENTDLCTPEQDNWVQCDRCEKWRKLPAYIDMNNLPKIWYCNLNTDARYNSCDVEEEVATYNSDLGKNFPSGHFNIGHFATELERGLHTDDVIHTDGLSNMASAIDPSACAHHIEEHYSVGAESFHASSSHADVTKAIDEANAFVIKGSPHSNVNHGSGNQGNSNHYSDGKFLPSVPAKDFFIHGEKIPSVELRNSVAFPFVNPEDVNGPNSEGKYTHVGSNRKPVDGHLDMHTTQVRINTKGKRDKEGSMLMKKPLKREQGDKGSGIPRGNNAKLSVSSFPNHVKVNDCYLKQAEGEDDQHIPYGKPENDAPNVVTKNVKKKNKDTNKGTNKGTNKSAYKNANRNKRKDLLARHKRSNSDGEIYENQRRKHEFPLHRMHVSDTDMNTAGNMKRFKNLKKNASSSGIPFYSFMHSIVNINLKNKIKKPLGKAKNKKKEKEEPPMGISTFEVKEKMEDSDANENSVKVPTDKKSAKKKKIKNGDADQGPSSGNGERKKTQKKKNDRVTNGHVNPQLDGDSQCAVNWNSEVLNEGGSFQNDNSEKANHRFVKGEEEAEESGRHVQHNGSLYHTDVAQNYMTMPRMSPDVGRSNSPKKEHDDVPFGSPPSNDPTSYPFLTEPNNVIAEDALNSTGGVCPNNSGSQTVNGSGSASNNVVNWVQCESCKKWRKVDAHININLLPDEWYCHLNFWNSYNNCNMEEEIYVEENLNAELEHNNLEKTQQGVVEMEEEKQIIPHVGGSQMDKKGKRNEKNQMNEQANKMDHPTKGNALQFQEKINHSGKAKSSKKNRHGINNPMINNSDLIKKGENKKKDTMPSKSNKKATKGDDSFLEHVVGSSLDKFQSSIFSEYVMNERDDSAVPFSSEHELMDTVEASQFYNPIIKGNYHVPMNSADVNSALFKTNEGEYNLCNDDSEIIMSYGKRAETQETQETQEELFNSLSRATSGSYRRHTPVHSKTGESYKSELQRSNSFLVGKENGSLEGNHSAANGATVNAIEASPREDTSQRGSNPMDLLQGASKFWNMINNEKLSYYLNNTNMFKMFHSLPKYDYHENVRDSTVNEEVCPDTSMENQHAGDGTTSHSAVLPDDHLSCCSVACADEMKAKRCNSFDVGGSTNKVTTAEMNVDNVRERNYLSDSVLQIRKRKREFMKKNSEYRYSDRVPKPRHCLHHKGEDNYQGGTFPGEYSSQSYSHSYGLIKSECRSSYPGAHPAAYRSKIVRRYFSPHARNTHYVNRLDELNTTVEGYPGYHDDDNAEGYAKNNGRERSRAYQYEYRYGDDHPREYTNDDAELCDILVQRLQSDKYKGTVINRNVDLGVPYGTYGSRAADSDAVEDNYEDGHHHNNAERGLSKGSTINPNDDAQMESNFEGKEVPSINHLHYKRAKNNKRDSHYNEMSVTNQPPNGEKDNIMMSQYLRYSSKGDKKEEELEGLQNYRFSSINMNARVGVMDPTSKSLNDLKTLPSGVKRNSFLARSTIFKGEEKDVSQYGDEMDHLTNSYPQLYTNHRSSDNLLPRILKSKSLSHLEKRPYFHVDRSERSLLPINNNNTSIPKSSSYNRINSDDYFDLRLGDITSDHYLMKNATGSQVENSMRDIFLSNYYAKLESEKIDTSIKSDINNLTSDDYMKIGQYLWRGRRDHVTQGEYSCLKNASKEDEGEEYEEEGRDMKGSISPSDNSFLSSNYFSSLPSAYSLDKLMMKIPRSEEMVESNLSHPSEADIGLGYNTVPHIPTGINTTPYESKHMKRNSQASVQKNSNKACLILSRGDANSRKTAKCGTAQGSKGPAEGKGKNAKMRSNEVGGIVRGGQPVSISSRRRVLEKGAEKDRKKQEKQDKQDKQDKPEKLDKVEKSNKQDEYNEYITFNMDYNENKSIIKELIRNRNNLLGQSTPKGSILPRSSHVGPPLHKESIEGGQIQTTILNAKNLKKHILSNRVIIYSKAVALAYNVDEINENSIFFYTFEESNMSGNLNNSTSVNGVATNIVSNHHNPTTNNHSNNSSKYKRSHEDANKEAQKQAARNNIYFNYAHNINFSEKKNTDKNKSKKVTTSVLNYDYKKIIDEVGLFSNSIKLQIPQLKYKFKRYIPLEEDKNDGKNDECNVTEGQLSPHTISESNAKLHTVAIPTPYSNVDMKKKEKKEKKKKNKIFVPNGGDEETDVGDAAGEEAGRGHHPVHLTNHAEGAILLGKAPLDNNHPSKKKQTVLKTPKEAPSIGFPIKEEEKGLKKGKASSTPLGKKTYGHDALNGFPSLDQNENVHQSNYRSGVSASPLRNGSNNRSGKHEVCERLESYVPPQPRDDENSANGWINTNVKEDIPASQIKVNKKTNKWMFAEKSSTNKETPRNDKSSKHKKTNEKNKKMVLKNEQNDMHEETLLVEKNEDTETNEPVANVDQDEGDPRNYANMDDAPVGRSSKEKGGKKKKGTVRAAGLGLAQGEQEKEEQNGDYKKSNPNVKKNAKGSNDGSKCPPFEQCEQYEDEEEEDAAYDNPQGDTHDEGDTHGKRKKACGDMLDGGHKVASDHHANVHSVKGNVVRVKKKKKNVAKDKDSVDGISPSESDTRMPTKRRKTADEHNDERSYEKDNKEETATPTHKLEAAEEEEEYEEEEEDYEDSDEGNSLKNGHSPNSENAKDRNNPTGTRCIPVQTEKLLHRSKARSKKIIYDDDEDEEYEVNTQENPNGVQTSPVGQDPRERNLNNEQVETDTSYHKEANRSHPQGVIRQTENNDRSHHEKGAYRKRKLDEELQCDSRSSSKRGQQVMHPRDETLHRHKERHSSYSPMRMASRYDEETTRRDQKKEHASVVPKRMHKDQEDDDNESSATNKNYASAEEEANERVDHHGQGDPRGYSKKPRVHDYKHDRDDRGHYVRSGYDQSEERRSVNGRDNCISHSPSVNRYEDEHRHSGRYGGRHNDRPSDKHTDKYYDRYRDRYSGRYGGKYNDRYGDTHHDRSGKFDDLYPQHHSDMYDRRDKGSYTGHNGNSPRHEIYSKHAHDYEDHRRFEKQHSRYEKHDLSGKPDRYDKRANKYEQRNERMEENLRRHENEQFKSANHDMRHNTNMTNRSSNRSSLNRNSSHAEDAERKEFPNGTYKREREEREENNYARYGEKNKKNRYDYVESEYKGGRYMDSDKDDKYFGRKIKHRNHHFEENESKHYAGGYSGYGSQGDKFHQHSSHHGDHYSHHNHHNHHDRHYHRHGPPTNKLVNKSYKS
ncbi:hypothetical protein AK88_04471 [Plasmodium fragile]|uniref:CW-type domain-containing protein n=1 Tax=Plasmodium fragile TaxID=5857 RepID=A0A0D9QFU5_PLAFR|nr:uncharacterized protein AK88_04471 [Plasmodium fragile]KJP85884.1 hypothetical protein AK88_04471 [Plasmodium fragile]